MTDITERLRDAARIHFELAGQSALAATINAGADEIDRLREKWADAEARSVTLSTVQRERDELRARVAELEAADGICFTAMLVEIDGHAYGLRPGAARIVREALRDAERYRNSLAWIATVAATEHEYQSVATLALNEIDRTKLIQWRAAHIDAAMAKDGAP